MYQYCRYWKILVKYWYYQYLYHVPVLQILEDTGKILVCTSIAAGCFILSDLFVVWI